MELQKMNVKLFVEQPDRIALTDFIDIFHGWIQATDGVYHDVADYSHMQAGPGIVLVANDSHVSIDESGNRRGLVFAQKAQLAGSKQAKLRAVLRGALENCRKLEAEPALRGKLRFAANEAVISLNDRRRGENSQAAFDAIKGDVQVVASQLFGGAAVNVARDDDSRQRLNVHIKTAAALDLSKALANLPRD
ncbi:MAG: hypothetical protein EXR70_03835 [Deltaproteobacteria bacterium]|nr:hypothetical protein [Deltaproteobacteria bacterium]